MIIGLLATSDHVVQNPPCWRASSLLFPHWDIKTKRPEPVKLDLLGAETNCGIAHILGILLMNSCNTDIFFSNYYHLQSVRFELICFDVPVRE